MAVLDSISSFEFSLWVVCAFLYLIDHLKLLSENELIYEQTPLGSWHFRLDKIPFTLGGRDLYLINPLFPWTSAFKSVWGENATLKKKKLTKERRRLLVLTKQLGFVKSISTSAFILTFIIGPYLTATRGLIFSLIIVVPSIYLLNLVIAPHLWTCRDTYRLTKSKLLSLILENFVCFPYTANLAKRLCLNYEIQCDGLMLAKTLRPSINFLAVLENATVRIKEREDELAEDPSSTKVTQDYIIQVRSFSWN